MRKYFLLILFCFSIISLNSQTWKTLPANGEAQERHENAFVQAGKRFILIGGRGNKPIDIYDTENQTWEKGAQPPLEIHHTQAVSLDGLVYILGAFTGGWPEEDPIPNIYIYDPLEDLWIKGPEIPEDRRRGAAGVAVKDKKIYLVNGITNGHTSGWVNWFDEYDPYKDQWKKLPDSPNERDHFQAAITGEILFVAGGRKSGSVKGSGFAGTVKATDIYDFDAEAWSSVADIPTPRAGTAIGLVDHNPVILGGESDSQEEAHSEAERYDFAEGKWDSFPNLKQGRHGTQAITLNKQIIIGAGSGNRGGGPELNSFEIFAQDNKLNFSTKLILSGKLKPNKKNLNFSEKPIRTVKIAHDGGNQAIVITDISISENFEILNKRALPFVLEPRSQFKLEIKGDQNPGELLIKRAGKAEDIKVSMNQNK